MNGGNGEKGLRLVSLRAGPEDIARVISGAEQLIGSDGPLSAERHDVAAVVAGFEGLKNETHIANVEASSFQHYGRTALRLSLQSGKIAYGLWREASIETAKLWHINPVGLELEY